MVPATGVAPGPINVKVVPLIDPGLMARLNVAQIVVFTDAVRPPFSGTVEITVGDVAVVKVQTNLAASVAPARFFAAVVIVAMYKVPVARVAVGIKLAEVPA